MTAPVAVVIPARNAEATIGDALAGLDRQRFDQPFEVIVVDDGSGDATARIAAAAGATLVSLPPPGLGPGPARNAGVAACSAALIAFLDADCVPDPGWLDAGVAALASADLVQGGVEADPRNPPGPFDHTLWVSGNSPLFETANLFVSRELFERLGGFEDWLRARIGKPLAEDVWLGWRARRAGARIEFAEDALVHHAVIARGPRAYVAERLRLAYFPAIVAKVPELRREFLFARLFLSRDSARFDLAIAGVAAAIASRRVLPAATALPYVLNEWRRVAPHGRNAPLVIATDLAADAVGLVALVAGSLRRRSPVL